MDNGYNIQSVEDLFTAECTVLFNQLGWCGMVFGITRTLVELRLHRQKYIQNRKYFLVNKINEHDAERL